VVKMQEYSILASGFPPAMGIEIARAGLATALGAAAIKLGHKSTEYRAAKDKREKPYALAALFTGLSSYLLNPIGFFVGALGYEAYHQIKSRKKAKDKLEAKLEPSKKELSDLVKA
jgi:hypothetical protein